MKRFFTLFFAILLCLVLLAVTIPTISIYLKTPMLLSGYSSLFETQFTTQLVLASVVLVVMCYLFFRLAIHGRKLLLFNLLVSILFCIGQVVFLLIMLATANKYEATISVSQSLKGPEKSMKSTETYTYLTIYNEKQLLNVYRPKTSSTKPSIPVICVHGGAFIEGNRTQVGYAAAWFTERGYTVFSIDYPLAKFNRQTWQSAANSVATAMRFVVKNTLQFNIDPNRFLLVGGSAGAALVMQTDLGLREGYVKAYDSVQPPILAGVIAIYPPVSLSELWQKMEAGKTVDLHDPARKYLGGSPLQFPQRYRQVNLIDHLSKGISLTLIVAGAIDHVVNVEATRTFVQKATDLKLPVSYVEVPYGEHVFDGNAHSIAGQIEWQKISDYLKRN